ncbi:3-oxo-tetronate kinase [uncultured Cohaesibacter sp.]|uniref:3-oxo-tetronate kinase n=1 Tax=uncultured Cohaesibacter sp. TaxID=1002546 RepID=UPI0029C65315|nr:3-oxo-tetronate kinase [uncultured Cohaesibacter sp.]
MLLGCIGDDFTGSSDLGNTLSRQGMRVAQYCGIPARPASANVDAGIVALKTRTIPVEAAVRQSLAALEWLIEQGCEQFFFKYCSTFDSTPQGNIGPVIDALMQRLEAPLAIVCPAFPGTGRKLFQGHLFVGDRLLSESGMQNHPLTPMTDPDIRRWLTPQTRNRVGHIPYETVRQGGDAIRRALKENIANQTPVVIIDAILDEDLFEIATSLSKNMLVTGGSGIALGLPGQFNRQLLLSSDQEDWRGDPGPAAVLAGSCSGMTLRQIEAYKAKNPARSISPEDIMSSRLTPASLADWCGNLGEGVAPLVYTSADPSAVTNAQKQFGREAVASAIEAFFAELARQLVSKGVRRLVVAGGETSGAVVEGLALEELHVGPQIAPGVPALKAEDKSLWIALKSGNFGQETFFEEALSILAGGQS